MRPWGTYSGKYGDRKNSGGKLGRRIGCGALALALCAAVLQPAFVARATENEEETEPSIETAAVSTRTTEAANSITKHFLCAFEPHIHSERCNGEDGTLSCGIETDYILHTHNEFCKDSGGQLMCQLGEVKTHIHTDTCFQSVKDNLLCQEIEDKGHTHSDTCYPPQPDYSKLICEIEEKEGHKHTDACYSLIRSELKGSCAPTAHEHGGDCYDGEGTLVCQKTADIVEHEHTDGCYTMIKGELHCDLIEQEGHKHVDTCYRQVKSTEPQCGETEREPGHIHSDACYGTKTVQVCTEAETAPHFHTPECLDADGKYICGLLQPQSHIHGAECWEMVLPELPPEERVQVDEVLELLKTLPTEEEINGKFAAFPDEDDPARDAYLMELNQLVKGIYAKYSALNGSQKAVLEAEAGTLVALLENLNGMFSGMPLADVDITVQYYAVLDMPVEDGDHTLKMIDTRGGKLPQNGAANNETTLGLKKTGGGSYVINTQETLTRVYTEKTKTYVPGMEVDDIDDLKTNTHYDAPVVWLLKDGASPDSVDGNDWIEYPNACKFTTDPGEANEADTVLIQENTVIRLVYNSKEGTHSNYANFYDYDISDGKVYTKFQSDVNFSKWEENNKEIAPAPSEMGSNYMLTYHQGINHPDNYSGAGAQFGFGAGNNNTGADRVNWGGQMPNIKNSSNTGECTFGIANRLEKGKIVYSAGLSVPKLFGEGTAKGKTVYGNQSLNFSRNGDTYTLVSVSGEARANNLDMFTQTHGGPVSNSFWPMDTVSSYGTPGHDLKMGSGEENQRNQYVGINTQSGYIWGAGTFDLSDDQKAHNSFFGMEYMVNFRIPADYVGPLNYYFYGDDDMWVFLDNQLVCDIGGVHSSIGEYVDLWDYIPDKENRTEETSHTLHIFYTERGSIGSSCFMQFTLPEVAASDPMDVPKDPTYLLELSKELQDTAGNGVNSQQEFSFKVEIWQNEAAFNAWNHASEGKKTYGLAENKVFAYSQNGASQTLHSGGTVWLKAGEKIQISGLEPGMYYRVTETGNAGYAVTVNGKAGAEASGVNQDGVHLKYVNRARGELPLTGGGGTSFVYFSAVALLTGAVTYESKRRRREVRCDGS